MRSPFQRFVANTGTRNTPTQSCFAEGEFSQNPLRSPQENLDTFIVVTRGKASPKLRGVRQLESSTRNCNPRLHKLTRGWERKPAQVCALCNLYEGVCILKQKTWVVIYQLNFQVASIYLASFHGLVENQQPRKAWDHQQTTLLWRHYKKNLWDIV